MLCVVYLITRGSLWAPNEIRALVFRSNLGADSFSSVDSWMGYYQYLISGLVLVCGSSRLDGVLPFGGREQAVRVFYRKFLGGLPLEWSCS